VVKLGALRFIPLTFVHLDHLASLTSDTPIGEEIGRIGKDHVKYTPRIVCEEGIHEFNAVGVVKPQAICFIVEDALIGGVSGGGEGNGEKVNGVIHRSHLLQPLLVEEWSILLVHDLNVFLEPIAQEIQNLNG